MRKFFMTICVVVFVSSAGLLAKYFIDDYLEQKELTDLSALKVEKEDLVTDKGTVDGKYVELYKANPDIIGWVRIKGTKINYPVMQTPDDNEYYLHRNFEKEWAESGTPFMDAASDIFLPSSNFLIYGHNMTTGTMFRDLLKYDSYDFYKEHDTIKFDTIYVGGQGTYKILAAGYTKIHPKSSEAFKYYQYACIASEEEFYDYVEGVKKLSLYDTGVDAVYGDQLITLSTCAYHTDNGRFFVVAKRTDAKQTIPQ